MDLSNEIERAHREGVSLPENLPFLMRAGRTNTAVLLVHGFTASPWEMRMLAEHLHQSGLTCMAVRLPGHGTTPEDLATRSWEEWLETVERGYLALTEEYKNIYAIGMSTGCLLLLALALRQKLSGLVLCSPYLAIQHRHARHAWWLRFLRPFHIKQPHQSTNLYYYTKRPVSGVHQINRLLKFLEGRLQEVTSPVLAFNGEGDETVSIDSGRDLYEALGSRLKIYIRLGPETPHILTREENPHYQAVFELAENFIRELEQLA